MAAPCPPRSKLTQFSAGRLSAEDIERVSEHLETCAACQTVLETLAGQDDLLQALAVPDDSAVFSDEAACVCLIQQLAAESRTDCATRFTNDSPGNVSDDTLPGDERAGGELPIPTGVRFGQYVLLCQIGRGGMGAVYQALHTHLERFVAIKMLTSDRMKDADAVARFEREMRAVGRLEHPHIVRAMDAGKHDDVSFLVMEFVHGPDVSAIVNGVGPLRVADACEIARQAAVGLEYAFRRGLVHRDIKPSNLMIDVGQDVAALARARADAGDSHVLENVATNSDPAVVRILDFGLALLEDSRGSVLAGTSAAVADGELTSAGQLMGTLDYIAPEQIGSSHDVDVRADIYSLGATLFKLLTGYAPFATDDVAYPAKRMHAIRNSDVRLASALRADLPADLVAIVARMLARDPAARFQSPAEVVAALKPFAAEADLKRLALSVWNPETTLVTITSVPSILAKQHELQDKTLPHLLAEHSAPTAEATTDRLRHDETGTNLPADRSAERSRTRQSSDDRHDSSQTEKLLERSLATSATGQFGVRTITRWVASVAVTAAIAAFAIPKWRAPEPTLNEPLTTSTTPPRSPAKPIVVPFDEVAAAASQQAWADELSVPVEFENSIGMRLRVIPPGKFTMGLTPEESESFQGFFREGHLADVFASSAKQREVTLTKPFAVGVTEVTVEQFARFVDATGHESKSDGKSNTEWRKLLQKTNWSRLPISSINWHDAVAFADWLSDKERATYSLPTEAEWEFACRAGRTEPWPESKSENRQGDAAEELTLGDIAWMQMPKMFPQPVGQKRPNAFGLHDMLGNAAEWCHDNFVLTVDAEPTSDPVGPPFSDQRVMRGGTLQNALVFVRPGFRNGSRPVQLFHDWGFRLVRRFDDTPESRAKFLRPAREHDEWPTPLGENSVEVGMFGRVDVPNLTVDVTQPITLELFVTPRWTEFRETRHVGGSFSQFSLFVTPDERGSGWSLGLMHKDRYQGLIAPARLEVGRRTHVAGVRDGKVARVFVDGKLVMRQDEFASPLRDSPTTFHLGGLMATIDEARLSEVARYEAEFEPRIRFEPDEHTVGLWHFDEGAGTQALDASGRGHHGVLNGAKWTRELPNDPGEVNPQDTPVVPVPQVAVIAGPPQPKITFAPAKADANNALLFGDNSRVVVPSLHLQSPSQWTVEMFATLTAEPGTSWQILGGFAYQSRILTAPNGTLIFANEVARKRGNGYAIGGLPIRGQRFHCAGVIDGDMIRFFINGRKAGERTVKNLELAQPGNPFTIGAHADGEFGFPGVIDEVRLSNVARYSDEFDPVEWFDADEQTLALYHCDDADGGRLTDSSGNEHHGQVVGATRLQADSLRFEYPQPVDVVYLDDLPKFEVNVHPEFGKHGLDHTGSQIEWRSQRPPHSLMVHPHANGTSHVVYQLDGQYEQFEGIAAITSNESFGWRPTVPLTFRVLGDDKLLWTSPPLRFKGAGQEFRIPVRGVRKLRLEAACPGDNTGAHCFWLAPRLRTKESLQVAAPANNGANPAAALIAEPAVANDNNALLFQDQNYVVVDSLKRPATGELTIECFTTATDESSGDWQFIAGWPNQPRLLKLPNGQLSFGLQLRDGRAIYASGPQSKIGERLHLAGVLDGSTMRLFVNGVMVSQKSLAAESLGEQGRAFAIGSRPDGSYQFAGLIDEMRVSSTARYRADFSPSERFDPDEHTRALFHGDELDAEQLHDSSGHEHHGRIRGAIRVRSDRLKSRARGESARVDQPLPAGLQFDGVDDFVSIPTLKVDGNGPYTLEVWLWQEQQRTQQFAAALWGESAGIQLQTNNGMSLIDGIGAKDAEVTVQVLQPPWPLRRRIHLAFCWHEQTRAVFVNGRKQSSQVQLYPRDVPTPQSGTLIGARSLSGAGVLNHFAGRIDELRLSNTLRYALEFLPLDEFSGDDFTLALYKFDEADGTELRDSSGHEHHGRVFGATWVPAVEPTNTIGPTDSQALTPRTLTPKDGWVEIGSKCRLPDDAVAGTWRLDGTALDSLDEAVQGHPPRLLLPLIPTGGYELEFTVTRLTGDGAIAAHLPVGIGECVMQLGNSWPGRTERLAGLQFINGQRVFSDMNPTRTVIELENDRAYRVAARVELLADQTARVQLRLDDKPLVDWSGPPSSLGADPRWCHDPLGLGTSDKTTARFENVRVRVLSDEARLQRGSR